MLYLLIGSLASTFAGGGPADAGDLLLFGNERILWVCQRRSDSNGPPLLRFAYRTFDGSRQTFYRRLPIAPVTGRILHAAVRGSNLHVFFGDGTHRRYAPPGSAMTAISPPRQAPELRLPDGAGPRALASDELRGSLIALVTSREAYKVDAINRAQAAGERRDGTHDGDGARSVDPQVDGDDASAATPTLGSMPALAFVRYEGGQWVRDRSAPAEVDVRTDVRRVLAHDGRIHLFYRNREGARSLLHQSSSASDAAWTDPVETPIPPDSTVVAVGWLRRDPVLVVRHTQSNELHAWRLSCEGDSWVSSSVVVDGAEEAMGTEGVASVCVFGSEVALAQYRSDGNVAIARSSLERGEAVESFTVVQPLAPRATPLIPLVLRPILPYVALAILLGVVFVARRETVLLPMPLKPGQEFPRLQMRVAALMIDLMILAPIWGPLAYAVWRVDAQGLPPFEQFTRGPVTVTWTLAVIGAVVGVYGAVFELVMRATPGKRLTGCTVVAEGGERCRASAILIRNAVRVVEFHFAAIALLVVLTPSRQRLGDMLAGTIVVRRHASPEASTAADEGETHSGDPADDTNGDAPR